MNKGRIAAIGVTAALSFGLVGWGAFVADGEMMGVMAAKGAASIVAADQDATDGTVTINLVKAPRDSFVVVHQNDGGMPGKRLGYARVEKGVNRNVEVKLDEKVPITPELLAAVHVDAAVRGVLEFDMDDIDRSMDKPYFVDGKEVAVAFKAAEFGVPAKMGEAEIEVGDQPLATSVKIAKATAPADAFVVVHKAKPDGMPGERVGFTAIKAGENKDVEVRLGKALKGKTKLIAAIHADRGTAGELEFDMDDPVASTDQPFFSGGMEVAKAFSVGPFGVKTAKAALEATAQIGAAGSMTIASVDAPTDAWLVVHKEVDGAPGDRVGLKRVKAGTSSNVEVELTEEMLPEKLIVALHADRGTSEVFDFDMMDKLGSADQPFFVGGEEVAVVVPVREFGYPTPAGSAAIDVPAQTVADATLKVKSAKSPEPAWVVVHLDNGGMPGARVGLAAIGKGTTRDLKVQLDASKKLTDTLFVAVHADRGESRSFEFDMMDKVNSPDQPFFVGGMEVATAVTIR